jgi:hypothetical protein
MRQVKILILIVFLFILLGMSLLYYFKIYKPEQEEKKRLEEEEKKRLEEERKRIIEENNRQIEELKKKEAACVNGTFKDGRCICQLKWKGENCDQENKMACLTRDDCPPHSYCQSNRCICDPNYEGEMCNIQTTKCTSNNDCGINGQCLNEQCVCKENTSCGNKGKRCNPVSDGYGTFCRLTCNTNEDCNTEGMLGVECKDGQCRCSSEMGGEYCGSRDYDACLKISCPPETSHGCVNGFCICKDGYVHSGSDRYQYCNESECPCDTTKTFGGVPVEPSNQMCDNGICKINCKKDGSEGYPVPPFWKCACPNSTDNSDKQSDGTFARPCR